MITHVLYHANCPDGMTAAWGAWTKLGEQATYHAVNYGDPMPDIPDGARVYLLDFSYKRPAMEALAARCTVTVLDHHKTAEADLWQLPGAHEVIFDMRESGASLAWDYFHNRIVGGEQPTGRPRLVEYAKDRDLWRFALPHSREISQVIRGVPYEMLAWDRLAKVLDDDGGFEGAVREGTVILEFQDLQVDIMTAPDRVWWREVVGFRIPVVNATVFFSEVGERLCQRYPEAPFAGYYFDRGDVRQWGLRRRTGDVDVSAIAQQYGGGGHAASAGWTEPRPAA